MIKLILIFLVVFQLTSVAQVVNIEKRREGEENKSLIGKTELSVDINKSISTILTVKNSTQLQYHYTKNVYLFLTDLQMMQVDTIRYLNNGFLHVRYNHNFNNNWFIAEAFTQVQFNKIQKILRRFLWGAGGRYVIADNDKYKVYAGTALMYEFELYIDNTFQDMVRMSDYISLRIKPTSYFTISHTTYYQPRIDDFANFRITNETSLETQVLKNLSFKSKFSHYFDSKPAPAVQKIFYSFHNGLVYRF